MFNYQVGATGSFINEGCVGSPGFELVVQSAATSLYLGKMMSCLMAPLRNFLIDAGVVIRCSI